MPLTAVFSKAFRLLQFFCMIVGLLMLCIVFTPLDEWLGVPLASPWTDVDRGGLILLSGATVEYAGPPPNRAIGYNTYWRTIHAIAVWRHGHFSNILISGVDTEQTVKPLLMANGIPESAILVENRATSTHENALFSRPILAGLPGPYVLLTSDYHMYRAAHCFRHEDIAVETMPAPDLYKRKSNRVERWGIFCGLTIEYTSIAYYHLKGWL